MPNWKQIVRARLAVLRLPPEREIEIGEEVALHLEAMYYDLLAEGLSEAEAQARTVQSYDWSLLECELSRVERQWQPVVSVNEWLERKRGAFMESLLNDLRYGVRMLVKNPGFTLVTVLTLALGIGVNTAILSAVNGFILRPLPVGNPESLVVVHRGRKTEAEVWGKFSYANYVDVRAQNQSFASLCAWTGASASISSSDSRAAGDNEHAEIGWGELVSSNYFDVMGVRPLLGRGFLPTEERAPNAHPVVVIGHALWQQRFNGDARIVGRTIYLNGQSFTVVGVMPESFLGSEFYLRKAFWVPLMMAQQFGRRANWHTDRSFMLCKVYGRIKPGVTLAQAEADLKLVAENLARRYPTDNADTKIQLTTELDARYEGSTRILKYGGLLALCVAGLVLLLACANVTNLMLARAAARAREMGIRLALGAGRSRIVRQLLTESLLLAGLGGALGWALAYPGTEVIKAAFPRVPYPINFDYAPDGYVLKWMVVVCLLTGVIFGLAPALLAARTDLVAVIKGVTTGQPGKGRRWNLRSALVVAQITISIVVLICAGLFIRNLSQVVRTDPGFRTDNLVTLMLNLGLLSYDQESGRKFFRELQQRLEAQPGVRAAALINEMPLMVQHLSHGPLVKEGEPDPLPNQGNYSRYSLVTPKYFAAAQTPLVLGRDFTDRDDADAPPVVIVNQEFARRVYGREQNALGKRFRFEPGAPLMEIIGIARDGRYVTLYEAPQMYMFLPVSQHTHAAMTLLISAQSEIHLSAVVEVARQVIAQLDSRMPVYGVMTAEQNLSLAYLGPRVAAGMATTFGVLALALALMGLYGVMTYAVSQRTHEIGIRMTLGAGLRDVLRLIIGQGMRMVVIGLGLGLAGALALTPVLASLLPGVGPTDPLTFIGVIILLAAVSLLACYLPARRAARVDPLVALHHD